MENQVTVKLARDTKVAAYLPSGTLFDTPMHGICLKLENSNQAVVLASGRVIDFLKDENRGIQADILPTGTSVKIIVR